MTNIRHEQCLYDWKWAMLKLLFCAPQMLDSTYILFSDSMKITFFWPHFKLSGKKEAGRTNWWLDLITIVSKIRPKEGNAVLPEWKCIFEKAKNQRKNLIIFLLNYKLFFCFWCHCVWWSCIELSPISDQFGFICNKFDSIKKTFKGGWNCKDEKKLAFYISMGIQRSVYINVKKRVWDSEFAWE